jgi:hypothetical protein
MAGYDSPDEGAAWALIDGAWQETLLPTPGAENNLVSDKEEKAESSSSGPAPCKPDQVRNPETGRCRKIVTPAVAVCKPDQVRSPETGRCRKIEIASAKSCPAGQERNAETNRCRKTVPAEVSRPPKVKDVKTPLAADNIKLWAAGFAATGSLGYAGYEWRRELTSFLSSLKGKFLSN